MEKQDDACSPRVVFAGAKVKWWGRWSFCWSFLEGRCRPSVWAGLWTFDQSDQPNRPSWSNRRCPKIGLGLQWTGFRFKVPDATNVDDRR